MLYGRLKNHRDDEVRWTAEDFSRDLQVIQTALEKFLNLPETPSANQTNIIEGAQSLCRKLFHRIGLEEELAFPLLDETT